MAFDRFPDREIPIRQSLATLHRGILSSDFIEKIALFMILSSSENAQHHPDRLNKINQSIDQSKSNMQTASESPMNY